MESQDQKPLLRDKVGLILFMDLRLIREHTIMHRDACSLSSLKEMGPWIFQGQGFSYKMTFMENPKAKPSFAYFFKKSVLELERVFLKNIPLLV